MRDYRIHLVLIAVLAGALWVAAYGAWAWYGYEVCTNLLEGSRERTECSGWYNESLSRPFEVGFLLKSLAISALLLLLFPVRSYRVWRWPALIFMAVAVAYIFSIPPYTDSLVNKTVASNLMGHILLGGTILIAFGTLGCELWQKNVAVVNKENSAKR